MADHTFSFQTTYSFSSFLNQDVQNTSELFFHPEPSNPTMPLLQFSGFCPVCETTESPSVAVGEMERSFDNESDGEWTLDYLLVAPLSGSVERMDQIIKLTETIECQ